MTDLDVPDSADSLYLARGDVSLALPVMQGDVYEGVIIPGLSDAPLTAAIVMHPCSLRAGSILRPKITVAAVRSYQRLSEGEWRTGHVNVMPLPELRNTDDCYAVDFRDVAAISSSSLTRANRIGACSRQGILLLQQRFAFHLTRLAVSLANLHEVSLAIFTETELLTDWVEGALDASPGQDANEVIAAAETAFHTFLDEDDRRRRKRLREAHLHADLRRECRREIASRYPIP